MPFRVLGLWGIKPVAQRWLLYPLLRSAGWAQLWARRLFRDPAGALPAFQLREDICRVNAERGPEHLGAAVLLLFHFRLLPSTTKNIWHHPCFKRLRKPSGNRISSISPSSARTPSHGEAAHQGDPPNEKHETNAWAPKN